MLRYTQNSAGVSPGEEDLHKQPGNQQNEQRQGKGGAVDRLRGRRGRTRLSPARLAFALAGVLAVAAAVLLVHYARQAASLRGQLEELRRLAAQTAAVESAARVTPAPAEGSLSPAEADATAPPRNTPAPPSKDFAALRGRNADISAWLTYPGIRDIDLPVVQRDNSFYMTHDYLGRENVSGSVFADQRNSFTPRDSNIVLYGHNMKNGTMFGKLYRLTENRLLGEEPFFTLETPESSEIYVPYAVALVDDEADHPRYFPIATLNYQTGAELLDYTEKLRAFSNIRFPVTMEGGDRLLTLVTCHGQSDSERLVVALRALRPDENMEDLREAMRLAF